MHDGHADGILPAFGYRLFLERLHPEIFYIGTDNGIVGGKHLFLFRFGEG